MSSATKRLLDNVGLLIKNELIDYNESDLNLANAYRDLIIQMISEDKLINEDMQKTALIIIKEKYDEINKEKIDYTEEELKPKLEVLNKLYLSYLSLKEKNTIYQDEQKEELIKNADDINVYYLYDENNESYYLKSLENEKGDDAFIKCAEAIVDKLKKGMYEKGRKRPVDGIDNCFFAQQTEAFVSFIMINENNYIILTSAKWKNLNYMTNYVYNNCYDQILDVKNKIAGEIK